jgi:hypothetical protein
MNRRSFIQGILSLPAVVGIKKLPEIPEPPKEVTSPNTWDISQPNFDHYAAAGSACFFFPTWNMDNISKNINTDPYVEGRSDKHAS